MSFPLLLLGMERFLGLNNGSVRLVSIPNGSTLLSKIMVTLRT